MYIHTTKKVLTLFCSLTTMLSLAQNVGIGTQSPISRLHVLSPSTTVARFESSNAATSHVFFAFNGTNGGLVGVSNNNFELISIGPRDLRLGASSQNNIVIKPNGNVGIGTFTPAEQLEIGEGNLKLGGSPLGVMLNAADRPLITRGFDPFTSGNYTGIGRWGLFMEVSRLTLGIPALSGRAVEFAAYEANGLRNTLITINENGRLRRPATGGIDLLPVAMGNIGSNGSILGGSNNFSVEQSGDGRYLVTFADFSYSPNNYIVIATINKVVDVDAFLTTAQATNGRLLFAIDKPNGDPTNQGVHFIVYRDN